LDASEYKENYRVKMIEWGEEKRRKDYGYFCRIITVGPGSEKPLWIISDARRRTDLQYFSEHYPEKILTVRVAADIAIRQQRGWIFTPGSNVIFIS
jgi:phosphomevalonate kinase